ncbi:MAG: glycosyltransferase family 1 protein [bacterium]|nr:glycosyltransferase family 1 protein [bacterium]
MTYPIALDYTAAYEQGGGIGRYVRELVAALARLDSSTQYRLFVAGANRDQLPSPPNANFQWKPSRITPAWFARIWHRAQVPLPVETFVGNISLYHATDFVLPPTRRSTCTILTVHDLSFVRVPEAASPNLKKYLDMVVPRSARRADHILADSQATKDDLISLYALPESKITVLLSGVDARFSHTTSALLTTRKTYRIGERPYLFTVGTVQPRKNYVRLVEALQMLRQQGCDVDLVIAGGKGWLDGPLYQKIDKLKLQEHVHLIGFAADTDLPTLYSGAACVAFPSLYEGFGFPVLEGMACGTPVVTSTVSSLPEVAGDAALMVNPTDTEAIADAIRRVLDDSTLRAALIQKGYAQAKKFTWENSARHLMQVYQRVLG